MTENLDKVMIKGVIFDMDGVLVDNAHIHIEAFEIYCNRLGVKLNMEALMGGFGMGNDDIMPLLFSEEMLRDRDIDEMGAEKEAIYREIFEERIEPTRGLVDFLHAIRAQGYKTAVGSSGSTENVEFVLRKCGIDGLFDAVVNGDMVERRKPWPDIYQMASKLIGLDPSECVVIEDAEPGVEAARAAGTAVIGLATTFPSQRLGGWNCDLIAPDFAELGVDTLKQLSEK